MPAHVSAIVQKANPGTLVCIANTYTFQVNGMKKKHGVISYYAAKALAGATTMDDWLQKITAACDADVAARRFPRSLPLTIAGSPRLRLPGVAKQ